MPLYFESVGLDALQIGYLIATGQAMRVVGPTLWGWIADHAAQRTPLLRATAAAIGFAFALLLVPAGFAWIFGAMFLMNLFMTAQMPIGEALVSARIRGQPDSAA